MNGTQNVLSAVPFRCWGRADFVMPSIRDLPLFPKQLIGDLPEKHGLETKDQMDTGGTGQMDPEEAFGDTKSINVNSKGRVSPDVAASNGADEDIKLIRDPKLLTSASKEASIDTESDRAILHSSSSNVCESPAISTPVEEIESKHIATQIESSSTDDEDSGSLSDSVFKRNLDASESLNTVVVAQGQKKYLSNMSSGASSPCSRGRLTPKLKFPKETKGKKGSKTDEWTNSNSCSSSICSDDIPEFVRSIPCKEEEENSTIEIRNLPHGIDHNDLKAMIENCGTIEFFEVVRDQSGCKAVVRFAKGIDTDWIIDTFHNQKLNLEDNEPLIALKI